MNYDDFGDGDEDDDFGEDEDDYEEEEDFITSSKVKEGLEEQKTIIQKLRCLTDDVKSKIMAEITEQEKLKNKKIRNDTLSSFIKVYFCCAVNDYTFDPLLLIRELDMGKKKVNRAFKRMSGNDTKSSPRHILPYHVPEPSSLIPYFVNSGNILFEDIKIIKEKCDAFYEKYKIYAESLEPDKILAYIIKKYYTEESDPLLSKPPGEAKTIFNESKLLPVKKLVKNQLTTESVIGDEKLISYLKLDYDQEFSTKKKTKSRRKKKEEDFEEEE